MRHLFGYNEYMLRQQHKRVPVAMDTTELVNGHVLVAGMSGSGKSHQLRAMLASGAKQSVQFDVVDVHDELMIPGATPMMYSVSTRYGYNPLVLNTDPHSGGVHAKIAEFIASVNQASGALGVQQEDTLRNALQDLYRLRGINEHDHRSWHKQDITEHERSRYVDARDWKALRAYYPTLEDLMAFLERKVEARLFGGNNNTAVLIDMVKKAQTKLTAELRRQAKIKKTPTDEEELAAMHRTFELAKEEAKEAFRLFVDNIKPEHDLEERLRYPSAEVLRTTLTRVRVLNSAGTMRANPPPFGDAGIRVHQVKSLSDEEQRMFVYRRMVDIFRKRRDEGIRKDVVHVIVLDEAHKFFSKDSSNILNVIAKEGRKFGLALWCGSQSPLAFPEDFLQNVGTTVLLGLSDSEKDRVARAWRIDQKTLDYVAAHRVASMKFQKIGDPASKFTNVIVSEELAEQLSRSSAATANPPADRGHNTTGRASSGVGAVRGLVEATHRTR